MKDRSGSLAAANLGEFQETRALFVRGGYYFLQVCRAVSFHVNVRALPLSEFVFLKSTGRAQTLQKDLKTMHFPLAKLSFILMLALFVRRAMEKVVGPVVPGFWDQRKQLTRSRVNRSLSMGACLWQYAVVLPLLLGTGTAATTDNVVIQWDKAALQSIRDTHPAPTVAARALAITHTCIFDAWAAYDEKAVATVLGGTLRRPVSERTDSNRQKAISFAAYRCLADLFPNEIVQYDTLMARLGYALGRSKSKAGTPERIGNRAASSILRVRHHDGSNQLGNLHPGAYSDYTGYASVNNPGHILDPDRWQPLRVPDGHGGYVVQKFTTPQWGKVSPFALAAGSQYRPAPPVSFSFHREEFERQVQELLDISATFTDEQRVIAEYWADGPSSELPPGLWCRMAQFISARDSHTLDEDVKMFFILGNALLDASIAAWDAKHAYDSVRPITAIHLLSSGKHIQSWAGPGLGIRPMEGAQWRPYQPATVMTPPFPEFVSGHSTFSAAAAEVLRRFTGSDAFRYSITLEAGSSKVEPGAFPAQPVTLSWNTLSEAADQAGMSRRYCGIHFRDGDLAGRVLGRQVAQEVWKRAAHYIHQEKEREKEESAGLMRTN